MATATNGGERMWCSHCCRNTPTRREGNAGTVKSCDWCGKILADETGTTEEYNKLFLRYLALSSASEKRELCALSRSMNKDNDKNKDKDKDKDNDNDKDKDKDKN